MLSATDKARLNSLPAPGIEAGALTFLRGRIRVTAWTKVTAMHRAVIAHADKS